MPRFTVFCLSINPADGAAVATGKNFFGLKICVLVSSKKLFPILPYCVIPVDAGTVRHRTRILKYTIISHQVHNSSYIMEVQSCIEIFYYRNSTDGGILIIHILVFMVEECNF